jgi:hypothetical protein
MSYASTAALIASLFVASTAVAGQDPWLDRPETLELAVEDCFDAGAAADTIPALGNVDLDVAAACAQADTPAVIRWQDAKAELVVVALDENSEWRLVEKYAGHGKASADAFDGRVTGYLVVAFDGNAPAAWSDLVLVVPQGYAGAAPKADELAAAYDLIAALEAELATSDAQLAAAEARMVQAKAYARKLEQTIADLQQQLKEAQDNEKR